MRCFPRYPHDSARYSHDSARYSHDPARYSHDSARYSHDPAPARVSPRAWPAALAVLFAFHALAPLPAQDEAAQLDDEQSRIRDGMASLRERMVNLAKRLEATQPDDAKRLKEAAERMRTSRIEDQLKEIEKLLATASFIEAIGPQDTALKEIDGIIRLLERSRFDEQALDKDLDEALQAWLETLKLADQQEGLLKKTRDVLDAKKAREALKALQGDLSDLKEKQSGLNQDGDAESLDRGATRSDEEELAKAERLLKDLLEAQEKVKAKMKGLPAGDLPIESARELLQRLDAMIEKAGDLSAATGEAGADEKAKGAPAGDQTLQALERGAADLAAALEKLAGDLARSASEGRKSEADAGESASPSGKETASGKEAPSGRETPSGKESGSAPDGPSAKETRPGKETAPGEESPSARETASGSESPSARESGATPEAAPEPGKGEAKEHVKSAAAAAKEARKGLAERDLGRGHAQSEKALGELKEARARVAGALEKVEEKNAAEIAGAGEEEAALEQRAAEAAKEMGKAAEKSSSEAARSALSQGSGSLEKAAQSMGEAAKGLEEGQRQIARAGGEKAGEELQRGLTAVEEGRKALGARDAAAKRADLQKKLARQAEEAKKKAQELEKKLRKKTKDKDSSGKLSAAGQALGQAQQAMNDAAEAGQRGDQQLAKKKGEEALQRLEDAAARVAEEERQEELARLERDSLAKDKKEQEELARLTRETAKKQGARRGGAERAQDLGRAAESMDQAGEELGKEDGEQAEKRQQEALERLRQAQEKLAEEEERLARLKKKEEILSMVAQLGEVKAAQEKINAETAKLHAGREGKDRESRREQLKLKRSADKLVAEEGELAVRVDGLTGKLKEELARVFTFILRNVSADMRQVRDSLKELDTGAYTQFLQKEVVVDLERLLAALKAELDREDEEEEQDPSQMAGRPMPQGRRRLVPMVAELRMLKEMQVDVNRGTRDLDDLRKAGDGRVTESWDKALDRLLQKQGSVSRMTSAIQKDFQQALAGEEEPEKEKAAPRVEEEEE